MKTLCTLNELLIRPNPVLYTTAEFYKHIGGRSLGVDQNPSGVVACYVDAVFKC